MSEELPQRDELPLPITMEALRSGTFGAQRPGAPPPSSGSTRALIQADASIPRVRSSLRPGKPRKRPRRRRARRVNARALERDDAALLQRFFLVCMVLAAGLAVIALGMSSPPTHLTGLEMMMGADGEVEEIGWDQDGLRIGRFLGVAAIFLAIPTGLLSLMKRD